jgi:hypothetical protein
MALFESISVAFWRLRGIFLSMSELWKFWTLELGLQGRNRQMDCTSTSGICHILFDLCKHLHTELGLLGIKSTITRTVHWWREMDRISVLVFSKSHPLCLTGTRVQSDVCNSVIATVPHKMCHTLAWRWCRLEILGRPVYQVWVFAFGQHIRRRRQLRFVKGSPQAMNILETNGRGDLAA